MAAFFVSIFISFPAEAATYTIIKYEQFTGNLSNQTLTKDKSPYLVLGGCNNSYNKVSSGYTFTIEAGVVVKFAPAGTCFGSGIKTRIDISGNFIVNGTDADPVIFTSWNDDSVGGDTNGDGNATVPHPGDWAGLSVENSSNNNVNINHAIIRYGGGGTFISELKIERTLSLLQLNNLELSYSGAYGLNTKIPTIITQGSFHDNLAGAIRADSFWNPQVFATNSWWGDASGPTTASNPNGKGQTFVGNVVYDPWVGKVLPNLPPVLNFVTTSGWADGVEPNSSFMANPPLFKAVYADPENKPPTFVNVVVGTSTFPLLAEPGQDGNYTNGEIFSAALPSQTFSSGTYAFHFETSDGQSVARLPQTGELQFTIKNDPVIIIPGILGSAEKNGVWVIDPIFHTYDDLIDTLVANGYTQGADLFTLPYNWRQSNVLTGFQLHQKIDEVKAICNCDKVDLVGHSMGGLVARQYVQSNYYENDVDQLIFLGTPHLGAPESYLAWEAGESSFGLTSRGIKFLLSREAKKLGYSNLFNYLRNSPIISFQELLPVYDYIRDKDTNLLRNYSNNYPQNTFLENLNNNSSSLFSSGIKITNIVGDAGVSSTINTLRVVSSINLPLWEHGYPDEFNNKNSDHGLEYGAGDATVPKNSAEFIQNDLNKINSDHKKLPDNAEGLIFKKLTNSEPVSLIQNPDSIDYVLIIKLLSPVDMIVVAPDGKRIGKDFSTGQEINEINGAFYSGFTTDDEYVTILNPLDGEYKVETIGTDNGGEYTVATGLITDQNSSEYDFTATTLSGQIISLNVEVNSVSNTIDVVPDDTVPPVIIITSPEAHDYLRSETLVVDTTSTDIGTGVLLHQVSFDGKIINNGDTVDLFFEHLGNHVISVTSTDFVGNTAVSSTGFRIIATPSSTISDVERAYNLGWIIKKQIRDDLKRDLAKIIKIEKRIEVLEEKLPGKPKVIKRIERLEKRVDKILSKDLLKDLSHYRDKGWLNDVGYNLLTEDINWLLNN